MLFASSPISTANQSPTSTSRRQSAATDFKHLRQVQHILKIDASARLVTVSWCAFGNNPESPQKRTHLLTNCSTLIDLATGRSCPCRAKTCMFGKNHTDVRGDSFNNLFLPQPLVAAAIAEGETASVDLWWPSRG